MSAEAGMSDEDWAKEMGLPEVEPEPRDDEPESSASEAEAREGEAAQEAAHDEPTSDRGDPPAPADIAPNQSSEQPQQGKTAEELQAELDAEKRKSHSLLDDLTKLRHKNRQAEILRTNQVAPSPASGPVYPTGPTPVPVGGPPAASQPTGIGVIVDGETVQVDQEAFRREAEAVAAKVAEERLNEMMKPTPAQQFEQMHQSVVNQFVQSNPERNQRVAADLFQADQFIEALLENSLNEMGLTPSMIDANQLIDIAEHSGIAEKVAEHFPVVGANFRNYLASQASQDPNYRRFVLDQIAGQYVAPQAAPQIPGHPPVVTQTPTTEPTLTSVSGMPQGFASMGNRSPGSDSSDEKEFASLEKQYMNNPLEFPKEKFSRYKELLAKLDKEQ